MYNIREASTMTGFSLDTLRYYEKMGLIQAASRGTGGVRSYSDANVHQILSIKCLKQSGLSLEDIKDFIADGQCFRDKEVLDDEEMKLTQSRMSILAAQLDRLEEQRQALDQTIAEARTKLDYYEKLMQSERGKND
ncbi:MerR family transcriptional regulator [Paenibacillus sp. VMFN-D1]|uniref:MerR family transcriptional regulator n=1 Tax=Paenibacillus sp. VMFN-D1 TaxID=2135608 RepID=UPI000E240116|nr:MerR family transcriptional regulator [Paenibacillus sp. VMFN-D1]RED40328.1 MerR family transcriptional regulator [Paenibacillus sp. VMFN-D1]